MRLLRGCNHYGDSHDMICDTRPDGWCERHRRTHTGRLLELALQDDAEGESYRLLWDGEKVVDGKVVAALPCLHLGKVLDRRDCNCPHRHVHACEVHARCTKGDPLSGLATCHTCKDYEADAMTRPEDLTPETPLAAVVELFELGPVGPWPEGWAGWRNVIDAHREIVEAAAQKEWVYPAGKFSGRGIVSCVSAKPGWSSGKELANGYLPGAWVMVKELRRLGCTLPITFCHLGPLEWDPQLTRLVEPLGVSVIDLREWEKANPFRVLSGWEGKLGAILAAPYEQVLFLDADNVPVREPSYLFDETAYLDQGAIFWPDLPPHDRQFWVPPDVWHNAGLPATNASALESGQLLIDKRKCWTELHVCKAINEHSDYWYGQLFGDKDTFLLAWHAAALPRNREPAYALVPEGAGWNGGAILQHDMQGRLLWEHGAQNKPSRDGYPHGRDCLSNPGECHEHLAELREKWAGKLWVNEEPKGEDELMARKLVGQRFLYRRVGLGEREIRLLEDNRIGRGLDKCEISWSILDGTLAVSDIDGRPTFLARLNGDGKTWKGRWVDFEKCDVELVPLEANP